MADPTNVRQLFFLAEGVEFGVGRVRSFSTQEGFSHSYTHTAEVVFDGIQVRPQAWMHAPATIVLASGTDTILRRYSGMVMRARTRATRRERAVVEVTLESPLALLRLTTDYRIFQNQTTQEIVSQILKDNGLSGLASTWRLAGSYEKREVCTQYAETCFDFVSRLLEEEGIFYYFTFSESGPTLLFADDASAYESTEATPEVPFREGTGLTSAEAITHIHEVLRVRPSKVTLRDHDFKRPALDLTSDASDTSESAVLGREYYEYPGLYIDPSEGKRRAELKLQAFTAENNHVVATGTATTLTPGHTFKLTGALDPALDQEWVVASLVQTFEDATAAGATADVRAILLPKSAPFRPPQRTLKPRVPGPQLATVTGPSGEEIHTDEFGRIKVRFPWDRAALHDDKSSAWVRVGQLHTSGSLAIPRVGWEVLVDFEDGDPDRPYVLGRLYNGAYTPPYDLPGNKAVSSLQSASSPHSGGRNEVRTNDSAGGEQFYIHAAKDMNVVVDNNKTETVTNNFTSNVGSNHDLTIGANDTLTVGANMGATVKGSQTWSVGASRTKTVTGDESITVKGSRSLTVGGSHTLLTPLSITTGVDGSLSETVGSACVEAAALGTSIAVAGSANITVGGAKVELVAAGKTDLTLGAKATTVGGAFISASGTDVGISVKGAKATNVGGAWAVNAGGDVNLSSSSSVTINVGGAVSFAGAAIVLKVGGSCVAIAEGTVVLHASEVKLTSTGPQPEMGAVVGDK